MNKRQRETSESVSKLLTHMSRQVHLDPKHKARILEELMRRHQELAVETTQRAAVTLRPRSRRLKRFTLVAPPAMVVAAFFSVMVWLAPLVGSQNPQAAEAARLTSALARTAPTVTAWQFTLRYSGPHHSTLVRRRSSTLAWYQRLYIRNGGAYLYSGGKWQVIPASQPIMPSSTYFYWQWAFARLPKRLSDHKFAVLTPRLVDGVMADGLRYQLPSQHGAVAVATAWVDRKTGLVLRLERDVTRGHTVVEHDVADYRYRRSS